MTMMHTWLSCVHRLGRKEFFLLIDLHSILLNMIQIPLHTPKQIGKAFSCDFQFNQGVSDFDP